ncbi:MAG: glutamate--tRNA ligase [Saprospiraceae bacterium]|nr:glutamate--tRNA ligase [Saprospiraceae bacterium]
MTGPIRVRFAPSPTGPLHIGGLRTALYNYLFAKKNAGTFILRIEDTDQSRLVPGSEQYIKEALHWCGLIPDEGPNQGGSYGPYRQSERSSLYEHYVHQLILSGHAYYAFDTPEEIEAMRQREIAEGNKGPKYDQSTRKTMRNSLTLGPETAEQLVADGKPYTVRMLVPASREITFMDEIRGSVRIHSKELDDKVILKTDGLPTYHLANVVDDHLMKISHVIRGEEWLPSTAHHVLLYEAFGWADIMPTFAHLPLILKPSGKGKLSKRDGQKFGFPVFPLAWHDTGDPFEGFDSFGFNPDAVVNFLAFLGWNPGTEQEIFSMDELVQAFDIQQISKAGARFDYDKARWYNGQYIQAESDESLANHVLPFLKGKRDEDLSLYISEVVKLLKPRIQTYREFPIEGHYFFNDVESYNGKMLRKKWKEPNRTHFLTLISKLTEVTEADFQAEKLKSVVHTYIEEYELSFGNVLPLLRIALCGDTKGPDLFDIMEVLGKKTVSSRFQKSPVVFDGISD